MLKNMKCLGHATIKIEDKGKIIYFDPFKIKEVMNDADIIFITHEHYDHFSEEDIIKVKKDNTKIVLTEDIYERALELGFAKEDVTVVEPNHQYEIENIKFETVLSYNVNKQFHPKENNWVGYIIEINNVKYYIAGDTDITDENRKVECDVAFLPVGGTYTMTAEEAASLANEIEPKIVVPIHYETLVGTRKDAENFSKMIKENIKCEIMY